ncbi:MAG: hypothetical protein RL609_1780 [Bacteroidota bacterium]|jgi:hypothetical protein
MHRHALWIILPWPIINIESILIQLRYLLLAKTKSGKTFYGSR